jgi:hypothetical protein
LRIFPKYSKSGQDKVKTLLCSISDDEHHGHGLFSSSLWYFHVGKTTFIQVAKRNSDSRMLQWRHTKNSILATQCHSKIHHIVTVSVVIETTEKDSLWSDFI